MYPGKTQKRHLTVLFSDLSGSSALGQQLDHEDTDELLWQVHQLFMDIIPKHGGTVSQLLGDGVYAIFGMEPHEDDGRRAVEAALEMHQTVKTLRIEHLNLGHDQLTLHSGIHSGLGLAREGSNVTGVFNVVADAVNIANRLCKEAQADEIVVSDVSLGTDRHFFNVSPFRNLELHNIEQPISVCSVLDRACITSRYHARLLRSTAELIGRNNELAQLHQTYEQCAAGNPQILTIHAAPGTGKTRLAQEFMTRLQQSGGMVLRGYCDAYLSAQPIQPLLQIFSQLLRTPMQDYSWLERDSVGAEVADRLRLVSPELVDVAEDLTRILQASTRGDSVDEAQVRQTTSRILNSISSEHPLVVFVDDWQWADDLTREVLQPKQLQANAKIMLLQTSRETSARGQGQPLQLQPLTNASCTKLVQALLPTAEKIQVRQICDFCGGNPLYVEELCHAVLNGRPLPQQTGDTTEVYNSLSMLIESRAAQLSPNLRKLLSTLAILGNQTPTWLAEEVLGSAELTDQVHRLSTNDLVFFRDDSEVLEFKHGITREVIYATTGKHERRNVHERAIAAIEKRHSPHDNDAMVERLAYHSAGTDHHQRTASYATVAGNKAYTSSVLDRARAHYQRAFTALEALSQELPDDSRTIYEAWIAISPRYANACMYDAHPDQLQIFERGCELAEQHNDQQGLIAQRSWLAYLNYVQGHLPAALTDIAVAQSVNATVGDAAMAVHLQSVLGQVHAIGCNYQAALPALDQVIDTQRPRQLKSGQRVGLAYTLAIKAMALADQGKFTEAGPLFDEAEEIVAGQVHQVQASVHTIHAGALLWQGEWEAALEQAAIGTSVAERLGSRYMIASSEGLAAYAHWQLHLPGAEEAFARCTAAFAAGNEMIWTSMHFSWYAEYLAAKGDIEQARHCAAWALQRARHGERLGAAVAYCMLAQLPDTDAVTRDRRFHQATANARQRNSARELAMVDMHRLFSDALEQPQPEELQQRFQTMQMFNYANRIDQHGRSLGTL